MRKPSRKPRRTRAKDFNEAAFVTVQHVIALTEATEAAKPREKDPLAVAFGRRGGLKGGKVRASRMTSEQRSASARSAARARWKTPTDESG